MRTPNLQGTNQHGLDSIHGRPRATKFYPEQRNNKHKFRSRAHPRSKWDPAQENISDKPNSSVKG